MEALARLLQNVSPLSEGPLSTHYYTQHWVATVPIGTDHTATIILDNDSLLELCEQEGYNLTAFIDEDDIEVFNRGRQISTVP